MSKKDSVDVNIVESQVVQLLERYKKLKDENAELKRELKKTTEDLDQHFDIRRPQATHSYFN